MPLRDLNLDVPIDWIQPNGRAKRSVLPYRPGPSTLFRPSPQVKVIPGGDAVPDIPNVPPSSGVSDLPLIDDEVDPSPSRYNTLN